MSYTPTYSPDDLSPITIDASAKLLITLGTMGALLVVCLIVYIFMRAGRRR
jgi:hypothetical protein